MKISKVIKALENIIKTTGDLELKISSDPEGNSFGLLGNRALQYEATQKAIVIYPVDNEDPMDD
jgi:hypothetical protein